MIFVGGKRQEWQTKVKIGGICDLLADENLKVQDTAMSLGI